MDRVTYPPSAAMLFIDDLSKLIVLTMYVVYQDGYVWCKGPGDILRPVYERWPKRRFALAQPEKMIMTQETRERIQRDIAVRKQSIRRKVSYFSQ